MNQIAIVGLGLIGGSLALDLRSASFCREIIGIDSDQASLDLALKQGVIDVGLTDLHDIPKQVEMVVLATPVGVMPQMLAAIAEQVSPECILTDVGSVKSAVVAAAKQALGESLGRFIPAHPIAGGERSGFSAAVPGLFADHKVILTPLPENDAAKVKQVQAMWEATGARIDSMPLAEHDQVLAATSHLPHILAFSLIDTLLKQPQQEAILNYAAGGFKDFTRIASSDPVMWRDIALSNSDALIDMIAALRQNLREFSELIESTDGDGLYQRMSVARTARNQYLLMNKSIKGDK